MAAKTAPPATHVAKFTGTFELGAITFQAPALTEEGARKRKPRALLKVRHLVRQRELLEFLGMTPSSELEVAIFEKSEAEVIEPLWKGVMTWQTYKMEGSKERDVEQGRAFGCVAFTLSAEHDDPAQLARLVAARCTLCEHDSFDALLELTVVQAGLGFEGEKATDLDDGTWDDAFVA